MAIWLLVEPQRLWLVPLRGNEYADVLFLSVPDTSRDARDSTNIRNGNGLNLLRNIGVNVINTRVDFFNPSVSHSSTAPLYCSATQRNKRKPFLTTRAAEFPFLPQSIRAERETPIAYGAIGVRNVIKMFCCIRTSVLRLP